MPFDPSTISGLKLWLKSDTLGLANNDPVGTWADQSGNGNDVTQGTAGFKPVYKSNILNGLPAVRFDGSDDYLRTSGSISCNASSTTFVVGSLNVAPGSQTAYAPFVIQGLSAGSRLCCRLTGTNWGTFAGSDLGAGEDLVNGNFDILEMTSTSGACVIYRNGTSKASSGSNSLGEGALDRATIGGETAASRYVNADITEVLIYDTALGTTDRQNVEGYLNTRWFVPRTSNQFLTFFFP